MHALKIVIPLFLSKLVRIIPLLLDLFFQRRARVRVCLRVCFFHASA
jgi:hypothetical protein